MPDDVLNGILDSTSDDQSANSTGRTPLVIDSDLRTIKVPTDYVFGVQNDQDVLRVPFVVPRYCDGVDLSELSIRINFTTKSGLSSYYDVTDKTVNTDTIEFAWLLGAAVFVSVGDLTFAVCIRKVEADGRITKEFNTTLATAKILPGLTVEDQKDPTQYSILVQMQSLADRVNATIEDAEEYAEQLRNYVGAPLVATAASDMTDQNRVYVYVGNENGYNNGHWYYYQSLTWHDGGTYNALTAGDYPDIYAGNVMSDRYQMDTAPYLFRPTGGGLQRIGERSYPVLVGASVGENQLVQATAPSASGIVNNGDGSFTVPVGITTYFYLNSVDMKAGHVYYQSSGDGEDWKCYLRIDSTNGAAMTAKATPSMWRYTTNIAQTLSIRALDNTIECRIVPQLIDLTAKLGSTIADYLYNLEIATGGAGVAKLREWGFLTDEYIPYNEGSLESVEATAHKMVGFNQFDKSEAVIDSRFNTSGTAVVSGTSRSDFIPCLPNTDYYFRNVHGYSSMACIYWFDANKSFISYSAISGNSPVSGVVSSPVNAVFVGINFQTEQIDNVCVNLSNPDRNGEYEPYTATSYPLGNDTLRGIFKLDANNNLYADGDRKTSDGTITRKYKILTITSNMITFPSNTYSNIQYARIAKSTDSIDRMKASSKCMHTSFPVNTATSNWNDPNKVGYLFGGASYEDYWFGFPSGTTLGQAQTTLAGTQLVYELATPTTEQSTPFTSPQLVYPDGTEEFITENGVPVGHETKYPYDLKTQAERLIDIPDVPSTNGTYVLKATRSSSGLTYTWVTG